MSKSSVLNLSIGIWDKERIGLGKYTGRHFHDIYLRSQLLYWLTQICLSAWWSKKDSFNQILANGKEFLSMCGHGMGHYYLSLLNLYMLNFSEGTKTYIYINVIPPHWHDTGIWNSSSSKTKTYLLYIINIMGADVVTVSRQGISNHNIYFVEPN